LPAMVGHNTATRVRKVTSATGVSEVWWHQEYPEFADDLDRRIWDLWAYIDARDAASAVEKALHYEPRGFETLLIAADDTTQPTPTAELLGSKFPHVQVRGELTEFQALPDNSAAKAKLGWSPQHSWRDHVSP